MRKPWWRGIKHRYKLGVCKGAREYVIYHSGSSINVVALSVEADKALVQAHVLGVVGDPFSAESR